ncbi:hypothetical protein SAMN05421776_102671 [Nocardia farcinica]|uniref:Uncharacterized protein n=1 Tax=Nocardia farcinica TaxID=37329 RepID=A0A0H5NSV5_NOCFR|nr:Uncharacterised protein [Nocardia farcinica]SIS97992.1 hypothetical protein SAMN05421776_102671 [Nocardia farcinica]
MASTSLPLATAAAVATLFAAPAGAVPNEPSTPATPAPVQPGTNDAPQGTDTPGTAQPGQGSPEQGSPGQGDEKKKPENKPTPSQPGVTTPEPEQVMPEPEKDPKLATPTQPGVTTPRVAPLPVPGQSDQPQPAVAPENGAQTPESVAPGAGEQGAQQDTPAADDGQARPAQPERRVTPSQPESQTETLVQEPRWEAPRLEAAPAAPVVEMTGPHQEFGANVDGGAVLPGYVANTHHFSNEAGYVGTIGYRTPTGAGEAGASVEFLDVNTVKVTTYTGGEGLADNKNAFVLDTTQVNAAKAAVEQWIAAQPGGAAALEAAAQVKLPPLVPAGDLAPQTVNVAGVTTQWGGSFQY